MKPDMKILVTGAGGFIGGWIVETLWLRGFKDVRAGVRRWSSAARIGRFPVEIVLCDVMDKKQVEQATEGLDAVIHCAVGPGDVIVKGTENVLMASQRHGVKMFVHLSTIDVYGTATGDVDETTPYQYTGNAYGDSKIEAEKLCWEYITKGVPTVVLRPTIVYGPYCKLWIMKYADRLLSGKWGVFKGFGEGTCNLVYVQDLVSAIFLSLDSEKAIGEAFNINGPDLITWNEYFRRFNDALGQPPLAEIEFGRAKLSSNLITPVKVTARFVLQRYAPTVTRIYQKSGVAQRLMKRAERRMITTPGKQELLQFSRKARYSISKAESVLGYTPKFGIDAGLELSARWLDHETLLSHKGQVD
jgi:nucleoside-diphosphate-sugar epimerase